SDPTTNPWRPAVRYAARRMADGAGATSNVAKAVSAASTARATTAATRSFVTTTAIETNPMASTSEGRYLGDAAERALASRPAAAYPHVAAIPTAPIPSSRYDAWM